MESLRRVFGKILVPEEVKAEVVEGGKDAYVIEKAMGEGWIERRGY